VVSAALGTQVVGSILRPASFCGCVGFKPSVGGINRGGSYDHFSQSCTGILAASLEDAWLVAINISERAGGDPGYPGLQGPLEPPPPRRPHAVAVLETAGWEVAAADAQRAFDAAVARLADAGIAIANRHSDRAIDEVEGAISDAVGLTREINAWEGRWPLNTPVHNELCDRRNDQVLDVAKFKQGDGTNEAGFAGIAPKNYWK
jgi:Asp-tRNA(Asn)/Glu-tRNA(Gln) amidotransferase A subunit family amidase